MSHVYHVHCAQGLLGRLISNPLAKCIKLGK